MTRIAEIAKFGFAPASPRIRAPRSGVDILLHPPRHQFRLARRRVRCPPASPHGFPDLIKRLREEAYSVAGRPEAAAPGWIFFYTLPATTLARRAGEFAALPPLSDRAFHHAVQERQVETGRHVHAQGIVRRASLRPGRAIRPVFGCAGRFSPSGQSKPDVDSHVEGHTNISAADRPSLPGASCRNMRAWCDGHEPAPELPYSDGGRTQTKGGARSGG